LITGHRPDRSILTCPDRSIRSVNCFRHIFVADLCLKRAQNLSETWFLTGVEQDLMEFWHYWEFPVILKR